MLGTPATWNVTAARDDVAAIAADLRSADNKLDLMAVQDLLVVHYRAREPSLGADPATVAGRRGNAARKNVGG